MCCYASLAGLMLLNAGGLDGGLSECVISRSSQQHRCLKAHSQIAQRTLAKKHDEPDKENKNLERPIFCQLMKTRWRSSEPRNVGVILAAETLLEASEAPSGGVGTSYCFTFPLRCTACLGGAKVTRYFKWNDCV